MAFASVRARASGSQNTDSTSHVIALPGGTTTATDVLLCFFSCDGGVSISPNGGWALLGSVSLGAPCTGSVWWKRATGVDALTLTTSSAQQSTHITISVRNAANPQAVFQYGDASPYMMFSRVYPPQGYSDYLCIASVTTDSSTTTSQSMTALPPNFGTLTSRNPTTTQSAATFTCEGNFAAVPYLEPGSATMNSPEEWVSFTVAMAFELHDAPTGSLTQPVIRSVSGGWVAGTGNVVVPRPAGLVAGDLMVAWLVASHEERYITDCNWDRADTVLMQEDGRANPFTESPYQPSARLFKRLTTTNDAAQPSFVFTRGVGGQVSVQIVVFQAGTFDPANPLSSFVDYVYDSFTFTGDHIVQPIATVNRGILLGFVGCSTEGVSRDYSDNPGSMTYLGRITTGWVSQGAYWQYPPQTGNTSPGHIPISGSTTQYVSLAILARPLTAVARIRTGRGVVSGVGRGAKFIGRAHLRTGRGVASGAGRGTSSRATSFGSTGRGIAAGGGRGARAQGVGATVATVGAYLTAASGTSAPVPVPPGVAAGTVVVVALWLDAAASLAVTRPPTFVELASPPETTGVVCSTRLFWTQASGADSGVYTFSWTGAQTREAVAFTLGRTASVAGTPFELVVAASSAGVAVGTSPAVSGTAGQPDELAVWVGGASSVTDWTEPSGWRPVAEGTRLAVASQQVTAGGPTGPVSGTAQTGWGVGWGDAWGI